MVSIRTTHFSSVGLFPVSSRGVMSVSAWSLGNLLITYSQNAANDQGGRQLDRILTTPGSKSPNSSAGQ